MFAICALKENKEGQKSDKSSDNRIYLQVRKMLRVNTSLTIAVNEKNFFSISHPVILGCDQ